MNNKRWLLSLILVFLLGVILILNFYSPEVKAAESACADNQIILRLSDTINAHGEVWNGTGNYPIDICYDEIFGTEYNPGAGPGENQACTGNVILRLALDPNTDSNGNAEIPNINTEGYQNVCFGGLQCAGFPANEVCPTGSEEVVSLSGQTNAHLENRTANQYDNLPYQGGYKICCTNNPPIAIVSSPIHKGIYFNGTTIEFNSNSLGGDSFLWTIEFNGSVEFTSTEKNFTHIFNEPGMRTITLRVVDSGGQDDENQIAIVIISSPGLFAYINKPFHREVVVDDNLIVMFNASDSYAINSSDVLVNGCPDGVSCLAGDCPEITQNVPIGCGEDNLTIEGSGGMDFTDLNFDWVFDDDPNFHYTGLGNVSGDKVYPVQSSELHDKLINLLLNYTDEANDISLEEDTDRIFTLLDASQCLAGKWLLNISDGEIIDMQWTVNSGACAGLDGIPGNGNPDNLNNEGEPAGADDCCPGGMLCGDEGCYIPPDVPVACSDYDNQVDCENDEIGLGDSSDGLPDDPQLADCEYTEQCTVYQCDCAWADPTGGGEECFLAQEAINNCNPNDICTEYICLYSTEIIEECTNGWMIINVRAEFVGGDPNCPDSNNIPNQEECVGGERQVPCGQLLFDLSFFDYKQFIAALIVITMIYFFVFKHRKEE